MKFTNLKNYVAMATILTGLGIAPLAVRAADNADVNASITILAALSATKVNDMNFGTWYFAAGSADTSWTKNTAGVVSTNAGTGATSTSVVANTTPAEVTVAIPGATSVLDGTVVNMTVGTPTAFNNDTDAALGSLTYKIGGGSETSYTAPVAVTIADATTATSIFFGGTITASDALTAGTNTASFNVSFAY